MNKYSHKYNNKYRKYSKYIKYNYKNVRARTDYSRKDYSRTDY